MSSLQSQDTLPRASSTTIAEYANELSDRETDYENSSRFLPSERKFQDSSELYGYLYSSMLKRDEAQTRVFSASGGASSEPPPPARGGASGLAASPFACSCLAIRAAGSLRWHQYITEKSANLLVCRLLQSHNIFIMCVHQPIQRPRNSVLAHGEGRMYP